MFSALHKDEVLHKVLMSIFTKGSICYSIEYFKYLQEFKYVMILIQMKLLLSRRQSVCRS